MVRDSGDGPGYGDEDGHVSRETGIESWGVRPGGRPVPQPRTEGGTEPRPVEPVRFEAPPTHEPIPGRGPEPRGPVSSPPFAPSPGLVPPHAESTRGDMVEFHVSTPNERASTGTLYGRGASPTVGASPAEVRPERRNPPSPRPHPSVVTADTEGAMTDAYVSRETEDPPLAQEAKRAVEILNPSGEITMPRPPRRRTMCVANQKGGVGKTTTAVNIAVALALHGNRVLVIDLDPQGNASTGLNVPHHSGVPDVYDCLIDGAPLDAVTQQVEGIPNLWAVPATIDLAGAEIELVSVVARESRLKRAIEAGGDNYDYIFIDCPPSLGLLTVNALVAAEEVLIPIQCEYYALEGVQALTNNIELVRSHLNPKLDITTVLLTMYDRRTRLADLVEQDVRNHFGEKVLNAVIPRNVRVSEAPSYSQSVMTYDPGSRGAVSYFEAAQEIALRGAQGAQVGGVA
ncbi:AAA family ATPase [Dactylosporangium sp. CA-233914]|uniref:ParA family protein n=1 Tax=Dactylosporangium sp. CA-233914 TaxID=3239934 RepID=UPI003D8F4463